MREGDRKREKEREKVNQKVNQRKRKMATGVFVFAHLHTVTTY